uniref:Uncharacterized protein n=1 Tax=Rhizophora mucronata TaxID=61149 RepID=A0A2P2KF64_RHIMU
MKMKIKRRSRQIGILNLLGTSLLSPNPSPMNTLAEAPLPSISRFQKLSSNVLFPSHIPPPPPTTMPLIRNQTNKKNIEKMRMRMGLVMQKRAILFSHHQRELPSMRIRL